jgi:uncharacterized protein (TIGR04551 family)
VAQRSRLAQLLAWTSASILATGPATAFAEGPTLLDLEAGEKPAAGTAEAAPDAGKPAEGKADGEKPGEPAPAKSLLDELDAGGTVAAPALALPPAAPAPTFPYVEYHGYLRFRPDLISNGHLGHAAKNPNKPNAVVTTSGILPPLSLWPANNSSSNPFADKVGSSRGEDSIAGASMRLRLAPTIHLADSIRIASTIDVLDNYVMGGDPDYAGAVVRPDVPLVAFATSTKPGAIAVKEVYGEWKTLLGLIRVGRQASHFGLGIFANGGGGDGWDGARPTEYYGGARLPHDGSGFDADFGSYVDRLAFLTKVGPLYVSVLWDYVSQGILGIDPARVDGQVRDLEDGDDTNQVGLVLLKKPLTPQEVDDRKARLLDEGRPAFDFGLYTIYRWQDLDQRFNGSPAGNGQTIKDAPEVQFMPREAWAAAADAWVRYERRLQFSRRIVVEGEFTGIYGKIANGDALGSVGDTKPRDILMYGGALKAAYQNEGIGVTLDAGLATGDDTRCFGVLGDASCTLTTNDVPPQPNSQITGFKFNKNYRVGSLLFRDVIGAVTNAIYVKPTVSINAYPFYSPQILGLDIGVLQAFAYEPAGTPGNKSYLGTEFEARGLLGQRGLFQMSATFAYLLSGSAFQLERGWNGADVTETKAAGNAWRLLGHLALMF